MREIKFRAWYNNTMLGPVTLKELITDSDWHPEGVVWQQYTGLKDKNGREIFEGDIFKAIAVDYGEVFVVEPMLPLSRFPSDFAANIGYYDDNNNYHLRDIGGRYDRDDWISNSEDYEVIGNIYESPELLKADA